jgi:hypothetical protein
VAERGSAFKLKPNALRLADISLTPDPLCDLLRGLGSAVPSLRRLLILGLGLPALGGCGDPCVRACRHVFDDCGLATAASEAACERECEAGSTGASTCARPVALQECFSAASCEALKNGTAAAECQASCAN